MHPHRTCHGLFPADVDVLWQGQHDACHDRFATVLLIQIGVHVVMQECSWQLRCYVSMLASNCSASCQPWN